MNAVPQLPPNYGPQGEPPRRGVRWKRILAWAAGTIAGLIVIAVIAIYAVLHTNAGRQYVLGIAEQKLSAAFGSQVHASDFKVSFSGISPTLDLYNAVVYGAKPYPKPPLLQVEQMHVAVTITSLVNRTAYLNDIRLDHPLVHVLVDAQGADNLPQTQSGSSKSSTNVFTLGVRHAQINRGEIYFNDRKSSLEADLHQVAFRAVFHPGQQKYTGEIGYRDGHLKFGSYAALPHEVQASFAATPSTFTLEHAALKSGNSRLDLTATVHDYSNPRLQAQYKAALDAGEFRRLLKNPTVPEGVIHMAGAVSYAGRPNQPMLDALVLNGDLDSPLLRVSSSGFSGDVRDLHAQYKLANGNLAANLTNGQILGGRVDGKLAVANITGKQKGKLDLALRGASLAQLKKVSNSAALNDYSLAGKANVNVNASWAGSVKNLQANMTANIAAGVAPVAARNAARQAGARPTTGAATAGAAAQQAQHPVPVTGHIQLHYNGRTNQISVAPNSYIRTPQTRLTLNGALGKGSALQVNLHAASLRELEALLPPSTAASLQQMGLSGAAAFAGTVRQTPAGPSIAGQLNASNLQLRGATFPSLRTRVAYSPSQVSLQNGQLQMANGGHLAFNVSASPQNGNFTGSTPLQVDLDGSHISIAALEKALGTQTPASGLLALNVSLHGTQLSPVGQGTITLTQGKLASQPVQSASLTFQANGTVVNGTAKVQLPSAGNALADFSVDPQRQSYSGQLRAVGIQIGQLAAVKNSGMNISGKLDLTASGQGTFSNPQLTATLTAPQVKIEDQVINALTLKTNVANHVANVALDTQAIQTSLRARATVQLTGEYVANATIDTQPIPLAPIVDLYAPTQAGNITGETEFHATLRGPLKNMARVDAHAVIPTLRVQYKNAVRIGAASPIHFDYVNGVLNLQRTRISGTDTDLQVQGSVPVLDRTAPMSLLLQGGIDLQIAQLFSPDITSSGRLQFNINSFGQRSNPNVEGQVQVINASFATVSAPIGLQNGNGVLTLTKDRLEVTQFQGTVGGGKVTARGGIIYRPQLRFDLALAGRNVRMLYPEGVREGFRLDLTLAGTPQKAELNGQVRLTQLSFTPDFDLMTLMNSFSTATVPPPSRSFTSNLKLNLTVQSTSGVNLVSRELSLQAGANLRVQGTADRPVILGRINITGGDLIFQGNRYVLQGGFIDFANPYQTEPVLNVRVDTTIQQYNIHMMFRGPVEHLQASYTSDPSLPPPDIISLIAIGKTTEASSANPTPGALGAESLIASQVSGQVTSRISKIAGISQLSVDPILAGSNQGNPGARITVQQRVTGNIFVTFSTDVTSTQNQIIQIQYKVSPRLSLSGTRNQNGGFGFDTRLHKKW